MKTIVVFLLVFLSNCASPVSTTVFDCDGKQEEISQFILKCVESANPKSDEEPEDWINMCQSMARRTYCKEIEGFRWGNGFFNFPPRKAFEDFPCTRAKYEEEKEVCNVEEKKTEG